MPELARMLETAVVAARAAGEIIREAYCGNRPITHHTKDGGQLTTDADRAAEIIIVDIVAKAFSSHNIIGEEEASKRTESEIYWIIDPIDGTTNFTHQYSHFAISICAVKNNSGLVSVVYDPIRDELFRAGKDLGAFLNDNIISPSKRTKPSELLFVTGFPFKDRSYKTRHFHVLSAVYDCAREIRRTGSAALDLAYLAAGRFDGYWEFGVESWDIAGGCLLVQEAGGIVTDDNGECDFLVSGNVIAANNKSTHELIANIIRSSIS